MYAVSRYKLILIAIFFGAVVLTVTIMKKHFATPTNFSELESYWEKQAQQLPWFKPWDKVLQWEEPFAKWFVGGTLNASHACLDAHLPQLKNKVALYWEDEAGAAQEISYGQLHENVNRIASVLKKSGVKKNDIVIIYMPMIPEAVASMLAVARLGAIQSVVFSGFSAPALKDRIVDTHAQFVITADVSIRRGKEIRLKETVDSALQDISSVQKVLLFKRSQSTVSLDSSRDIVINDLLPLAESYIAPEPVEATQPLFILYTSGTTGKPKGIMHSTGGYLTYIYSTMKEAFNIQSDSVYWCTADIGWITGHSYVAFGPLMHGISGVMYEGAPDFPKHDRWWELIQKYKVSIFYTSPTALRMFMRFGDDAIKKHDLQSLKILGSVGEPINPEVWEWYKKVIGNNNCPVIDTWWQTETGGFMISPRATQAMNLLKAGSASMPMPHIDAAVVDEHGKEVPANTKGFLIIRKPWPGMTMGIYKDPNRFKEVYWSKFKGAYYTGDYAQRDEDGYFWLLGRADEVLNIAGHRVGTAELESAAIMHNAVVEAAAIGVNDAVKGENVVLFVTLKSGVLQAKNLKKEITQTVKEQVGAFVTPKDIYFVERLPKTRSGKIMRRVLRAIVEGAAIGDISTLEDEASVLEIQKIIDSINVTED